MNLAAILGLGFFLGMRHATDADHVVAVSAIVSRQRTIKAAAPLGILWGVGHTLTILLVGGAIVVFEIAIPPRLGLGLELAVAVMLVMLGALNVRGALVRGAEKDDLEHVHAASHARQPGAPRVVFDAQRVRTLLIGVVHGVAGSAAVALLVIGTIASAAGAFAYLLVFGLGTVAGMLVITTALAMPVAAAAERWQRLHRLLGFAAGALSIALGMILFYEIGFVQGLFTGAPEWEPH